LTKIKYSKSITGNLWMANEHWDVFSDGKIVHEAARRYEIENETEPATKSAANSELKAVNRTVHRAVVITDDNDDDDDDDDGGGGDDDSAAAILLLVVSNKSSLSMTRSPTH